VLAPAAVAKACRAIETLEKIATARELTVLLEPAGAPGVRSREKGKTRARV
jgi:hypothetical protein